MFEHITSRVRYLIYRLLVRLRFYVLSTGAGEKQEIVDRFHELYYDSSVIDGSWKKNRFLGIQIMKCPMDLLEYQEIIFDIQPDVIVESGTAYGGTTLFMATICDAIGKGKILSIDVVDYPDKPKHKRIEYVVGSSTDEAVFKNVKKAVNGKKTMVILDSKHTKAHVFAELQMYNSLVSKNSYIIVEDTNVNGHPVYPTHGPGPMEALDEFLELNKNFVSDRSRESGYITFNPRGYLKRIK